MNKVEEQFSKYAKSYSKYNIIQQIVSKALVRELWFEPRSILELGCGSGQIYKNINFSINRYKAIDFSHQMCAIHPKDDTVEVCCFDFDTKEFRDSIQNETYDIVLSASALQWSKDLDKILETISKVTNSLHMALFTSNTFKTIFDITKKTSPILSLEQIKQSFDKYFNVTYEVINYNLEFESKKELFDYIKNSGVSGEQNKLTYQEAKELYKSYDKNYLEFEVVFIKCG